jgi:hypothetical protein
MKTQSTPRSLFIRTMIVVNGLNNLLVGLALIFAPQWFFANIGRFPPYNRHFLGDVGVLMLPLGAGLLWAARDPVQHKSLIGVAVAGSWLHALNHLYEDLIGQALSPLFFTNTLPLLALAVLLSTAYFAIERPVSE